MVQDPDSPEIDIIVDSVNYRLHDGKHSISVTAYKDGKITVTPNQSMDGSFLFRKSDPQMITAISKLIWRAAQLKCDTTELDG